MLEMWTLVAGDGQLFQSMTSGGWWRDPKKPLLSGQLNLSQMGSRCLNVSQTMTLEEPAFWLKQKNGGIGAPGAHPSKHLGTAIKGGQMEGDMECHRLLSQDAICVYSAGKSVCSLLYHAGARNMDQMQLQRVMHLKKPKAKDQRKEHLVIGAPAVVATLCGSVVGEDEQLIT
jgi:hypothetical protein